MGAGKILIFADCMPIGPDGVDETNRFAGLIQKFYKDYEVKLDAHSGDTSSDAIGYLKDINENYNIGIIAWGVNDCLPRGLLREQRASIIKWMYKMKFSDTTRLMWRRIFLNPLEYALLHITGAKFYCALRETERNFKEIIRIFRQKGITKIAIVSINPVKNYRFGNVMPFIKQRNAVIKNVCLEYGVPFIDTFSTCMNVGVKKVLAEDMFHLSQTGHNIVASAIQSTISEQKWIT